MNIAKFLENHAGQLANIADSLAIILGGLGIHPNEAAKVHGVIGALRNGAAEIYAALANAKNPDPANPVELIKEGSNLVTDVRQLLA